MVGCALRSGQARKGVMPLPPLGEASAAQMFKVNITPIVSGPPRSYSTAHENRSHPPPTQGDNHHADPRCLSAGQARKEGGAGADPALFRRADAPRARMHRLSLPPQQRRTERVHVLRKLAQPRRLREAPGYAVPGDVLGAPARLSRDGRRPALRRDAKPLPDPHLIPLSHLSPTPNLKEASCPASNKPPAPAPRTSTSWTIARTSPRNGWRWTSSFASLAISIPT